MPKKPPVPAAAVYTLKITLTDLEPEIWRSVEVRGDTTLGKLHRIIQAVMGWEDCHMHLFRVGKQMYGVPSSDDFGPPTEDERKITVAELLAKAGKKLTYIYDLGDDWMHEVAVEKVAAPVGGTKYPRCIGGARACPPEDCGGVPGYMNLLEALSDPKHEQHEDLAEWVGGEFDPEAFDLKAADRTVGKVR